jgi:hypothetical protein
MLIPQIWTIDLPRSSGHDTEVDVEGEGDVMLYALSKLVAIPTVSDEEHRERWVWSLIARGLTHRCSCRQGAHLLKKILSQLGAQADVVRPMSCISKLADIPLAFWGAREESASTCNVLRARYWQTAEAHPVLRWVVSPSLLLELPSHSSEHPLT